MIGIIAARIDSKRLPHKALKCVNGIPLIGYVFERARRIRSLNKVVLATTNRDIDNPLVKYAEESGIIVFRGQTYDVAARFLNCSRHFKADYFVRLNADSPFVDVDLISQGIELCITKPVDIVTNIIGRTYPYGISVEIVSRDALERAYDNMTTRYQREHVTPYFYNHPHQFSITKITSEDAYLADVRAVVDTGEDFNNFTHVVSELGGDVYSANYRKVASIYRLMTGQKN